MTEEEQARLVSRVSALENEQERLDKELSGLECILMDKGTSEIRVALVIWLQRLRKEQQKG